MPTLRDYRRAVAPRLGPYAQGTADAASTTTVLACPAWPFKSSLAQDDLWADQYLFRPGAGAEDRTRVVATATVATGQYAPDLAWTTAPDGEVFEVHGVVPPVLDGVSDLHALINEALRTCVVVGEVTLAPVAGATRHSLALAAPWLEEPSWVHQVGYLSAQEIREEVDPFRRALRGEAYKDGGTVYVQHGAHALSPADTLYVRLLKPGSADCRAAGGAWGTQTGLVLESDEAPVPVEWVVAATLVQAWLRLANVLAPADSQRAGTELAKAAAQAARFQRNYLEAHRPKRTLRPLLAWGPRRWR
jgi:hypothetical protein